MLTSITIMSGGKTTKGLNHGKRFIIDKGATINGGAKNVSASQFATPKQLVVAVLAKTGLLNRVPYSGIASVCLDGNKYTAYFAPKDPRKQTGRKRRHITNVTVNRITVNKLR